jgi:heme A synthase
MKNTDKLIAILAIIMLILYVMAVFYAFYLSWKSKEEPGAFKYVLTFITGLVGGIVALGFGVKLPDNISTNNPPAVASAHALSKFESKF